MKEDMCDCNVIHQDTVDKIKKQMPNKDLFYELADFFKILGDQTRMKILFALDKDEMCVCDIANVLGMSKSSISHQLATLRKSGIVKNRRVGKEVFYTLDDDHVKNVFEIGIEHIEHKNKLRG
jgi:ArsR family transcriptional regulator